MTDGNTVEAGSIAMTPGLEASWRSLEVGGAIVALLGILAILFPFATGVSISILLGGLLVVGGFVHVAHAFRARGWKGFGWQAFLALIYAFAGMSLLANPVLGLTTLTLLLVVYFLTSGIVEVAMGLEIRGEPNWAWVAGSGVLSILLGVLLLGGFPGTAAWAVGLLLGVDLLGTGISMVMVGRGVHHQLTSQMASVGSTED